MKKIKNYNNRHLDIFKPNEDKILIVGAGGIGSVTCLALAKMGCQNITVADFDKVEEHNIGPQFYKISQIGMLKVEALKENIKDFSDVEINTIFGKISKDGIYEYEMNGLNEYVSKTKAVKLREYEIVIMAVDSLEARREIFEVVKDKFQLLIDARMGGQIFNIYTHFGYEQDRYLETIPDESEVLQEPCTAKAIAFNTFGIASFIGALVKKYQAGEQIERALDGCYVNFFYEYSNKL